MLLCCSAPCGVLQRRAPVRFLQERSLECRCNVVALSLPPRETSVRLARPPHPSYCVRGVRHRPWAPEIATRGARGCPREPAIVLWVPRIAPDLCVQYVVAHGSAASAVRPLNRWIEDRMHKGNSLTAVGRITSKPVMASLLKSVGSCCGETVKPGPFSDPSLAEVLAAQLNPIPNMWGSTSRRSAFQSSVSCWRVARHGHELQWPSGQRSSASLTSFETLTLYRLRRHFRR